jgi:type IV secretion system protein VirD4
MKMTLKEKLGAAVCFAIVAWYADRVNSAQLMAISVIAGLAIAWIPVRKAGESGWTHGTARLADGQDLQPLKGNSGLILGRMGNDLIRLPFSRFVHGVTIAPSGSGKGVSVIIPNFLAGVPPGAAALIVDPKFEAFHITANWRRQQGSEIVVLDPLLVTGCSTSLNPMICLDVALPSFLDDCMALADALVVRPSEGEKEPHWNNSSVKQISTFIAFVAIKGKPDQRNLQSVAGLMSSEENYLGVLKVLQESPQLCDGMLQRMAFQLSRLKDKELASVLSTSFEHLAFLNSSLVNKFTSGVAEASFDPRKMLNGNVSVYYGLPADQLRPLNRLSRLVLTSILRTYMAAGPDRNRSCYLFLDELATLGPMPVLEDAVTLLRGYGVKTWSFFQSLGQVSDVFPGPKAQTFLSNMNMTQFFQPNDLPTAEEISKRIGTETISVNTNNGGGGWSTSHSNSGSDATTGRSGNTGWSVSDTGRVLLMPEEILKMGSNRQILFVKDVPPIMAGLVRYYSDREFRGMF